MQSQIEAFQTSPSEARIHLFGALAIVTGVVAAIGVVLLVAMFLLFALKNMELGLRVGRLNDICVAIQYTLTIPLALLLHRLLLPHNARWMPIATALGILGMVAIVLLQLALVFELLPFERQVGWVTLAMFGAVGPWLVIIGLAARSTEKMPHSLLMSLLAVPYLGFPAWAIWLGKRLLAW